MTRLRWLALGTATACVAALLAGLSSVRTYRAEKRAILAPRALPPALDSNDAPPGRPAVYLVGDSQIAHWPLGGTPQWRLFRSGFPGEATPNIAAAVLPLFPTVRPDVVVIISGGNDAAAIALLPAEAREAAEARTLSAFRSLKEAARAAGARAVFIAHVSAGHRRGLASAVVWGGALEETARHIDRDVTGLQDEGCTVFELGDFLGVGPDRDWDRYLTDGVHLNGAAYARLSDTLGRRIAEVRR